MKESRAWKQRNSAKVRLAARRAKLIRDGIKESINTKDVVEAFLHNMPSVNMTTEQARDWARANVRPNNTALMAAFRTVYSEAYVLGEDIALSAIAKAKINKAPTKQQLQRAIGVNWANWKPGNRAAAALVQPPKGLQTLLDRRGVTIQGLNRTSLDRIGTALANALKKGQTPQAVVGTILEEIAGYREKLAKDLEIEIDDILSDSERALNIAQTEMSRAVSVANRELYEDSGVELVEWLVAEPCDLCQENADASPIRIDERFPSGDTEPPAHPNCVCDIAPYVVDTRNLGEDAISIILGNED
jgi:hypothetical protein